MMGKASIRLEGLFHFISLVRRTPDCERDSESHHEREKQKNSAFEILRQMRAPTAGSASDLAAQTVLKVVTGK